MNPKAEQIHAANAERIRAERLAMAARWLQPPRRELAMKGAVAEAEIEKVEGVERSCLNCKALFISDGPGNRLCDACRKLTEGPTEVSIGGWKG